MGSESFLHIRKERMKVWNKCWGSGGGRKVEAMCVGLGMSMVQLCQKTALLDHSQQNSLCSLLEVNKDYIILEKWEGVLGWSFIG